MKPSNIAIIRYQGMIITSHGYMLKVCRNEHDNFCPCARLETKIMLSAL